MIAPTVTWKPWKPVSMKNVEPKTPGAELEVELLVRVHVLVGLHAEEGDAEQRSSATSPKISCARWLAFSAQWAHVTVTPEVSSSSVLSAGCPTRPSA